MSDLSTEIRAGYARGWSYTPVRGKAPILRGWNTAARASLAECLRWAARGNVGLRTGRASGLVVIDLDPGHDVLDLPETVTAITGRPGASHLYYRAPADVEIRNSTNRLGQNIDVRGEGGQVVSVGSVHPDTGVVYRWADGLSPDDVEIAELPEWVVAELTGRVPAGV